MTSTFLKFYGVNFSLNFILKLKLMLKVHFRTECLTCEQKTDAGLHLNHMLFLTALKTAEKSSHTKQYYLLHKCKSQQRHVLERNEVQRQCYRLAECSKKGFLQMS